MLFACSGAWPPTHGGCSVVGSMDPRTLADQPFPQGSLGTRGSSQGIGDGPPKMLATLSGT